MRGSRRTDHGERVQRTGGHAADEAALGVLLELAPTALQVEGVDHDRAVVVRVRACLREEEADGVLRIEDVADEDLAGDGALARARRLDDARTAGSRRALARPAAASRDQGRAQGSASRPEREGERSSTQGRGGRGTHAFKGSQLRSLDRR